MITTERLRIYPANREQMEAVIAAEEDPELRKAYSEMLQGCLDHPEQWDWYSAWFIELHDGRRIGDLCFKGLSPEGTTEIGYGVLEEYQGQGYAAEAVQAAVAWTLQSRDLKMIEAETEPGNIASQKVLAKCGFFPNGKTGEEGPRFTFSGNYCLNVGDKTCRVIKLLGHGKGGYSYLTEYNGKPAVLKQIHHEPCDYYTFGNKIESEKEDYERLRSAGIRIPEMYAIDMETERILKEYIDGPVISDLVKSRISIEPYLEQVREMAASAKAAMVNIDYYPTNFVVCKGMLWYIDYECNKYMEKWDFEHWGKQYWVGETEATD